MKPIFIPWVIQACAKLACDNSTVAFNPLDYAKAQEQVRYECVEYYEECINTNSRKSSALRPEDLFGVCSSMRPTLTRVKELKKKADIFKIQYEQERKALTAE